MASTRDLIVPFVVGIGELMRLARLKNVLKALGVSSGQSA